MKWNAARISLTGLLFLLASGPLGGQDAAAPAGSLHVVIVGDTLDRDLGPGVEKDIQSWKDRVNEIVTYTGLTLKQTVLTGDQVTATDVSAACNGLEVQPTDVVLFHYSGHGFHVESMKTKWPALQLRGQDALALSAIYRVLNAKKPRLLLVMADSCNNLIPEEYAPSVRRSTVRDSKIKANYRKLFIESSGGYIASGCKVGQFSWGSDSGGYFTITVLDKIKKAVYSYQTPSWEGIFDAITGYPVYEKGTTVQEAQFEKNPSLSAPAAALPAVVPAP